MTNYERIKSMSIDEMAKFICQQPHPCKWCDLAHNPYICSEAVKIHKQWLEDEEETNGEIR